MYFISLWQQNFQGKVCLLRSTQSKISQTTTLKKMFKNNQSKKPTQLQNSHHLSPNRLVNFEFCHLAIWNIYCEV